MEVWRIFYPKTRASRGPINTYIHTYIHSTIPPTQILHTGRVSAGVSPAEHVALLRLSVAAVRVVPAIGRCTMLAGRHAVPLPMERELVQLRVADQYDAEREPHRHYNGAAGQPLSGLFAAVQHGQVQRGKFDVEFHQRLVRRSTLGSRVYVSDCGTTGKVMELLAFSLYLSLSVDRSRGLHADNHSIVYINFGSHKVAIIDQNVFSTWYEQLGNLLRCCHIGYIIIVICIYSAFFGGLASLAFGASIISVVEIIYFGTGKFGALFFARHRTTQAVTIKHNFSNGLGHSHYPQKK